MAFFKTSLRPRKETPKPSTAVSSRRSLRFTTEESSLSLRSASASTSRAASRPAASRNLMNTEPVCAFSPVLSLTNFTVATLPKRLKTLRSSSSVASKGAFRTNTVRPSSTSYPGLLGSFGSLPALDALEAFSPDLGVASSFGASGSSASSPSSSKSRMRFCSLAAESSSPASSSSSSSSLSPSSSSSSSSSASSSAAASFATSAFFFPAFWELSSLARGGAGSSSCWRLLNNLESTAQSTAMPRPHILMPLSS
mmetsp:Transcript_65007/g.113335  ORF Transcript_65007/g.113335 Transcript_65007/m.113335 type:complete len:254 (-) Transcript_65007:254-1015(-)